MPVERWRPRQTREQDLSRWLRSRANGFAEGTAANPSAVPSNLAMGYQQAKGQRSGAGVFFAYDWMIVP